MHFMKHIMLFIINHLMQLKRKWLSLPLLLIFPIMIVALTAVIFITFFSPADKEPIKIGLVDLDQSNETQLAAQLLEESAQFGSSITIHSMSEKDAATAIHEDEISSYIIFPENFTSHLYQGESVDFSIVGNPIQPTESYLIHELMETVARHIRASQANILTINYYARDFGMDDEARNDFVFGQFQEFLFYTIGRDRVLNEREISNYATSSPVTYFAIGGWFIIISVWIFLIYHFLTKENPSRLNDRMRLYGVTELQQLLAKIVVTLGVSFLFTCLSFYLLKNIVETEVLLQDYIRIAVITALYSSLFVCCLAIFEVIISSYKLRMLVHSVFTVIALLISGAMIPVIYYPLAIQAALPYMFSYEALQWIQEILLNDRLYADYIPLLLMNASGFFILISVSLWKGRVKR
ncbi:ABC transporter permease [Oceanobacillus damuensis]|uniref:ABC transporter permease n=1 Tax=Oceanobacillus damuensis TaxID=937928 RepID=UPI0008366DB5|nr:ABC transporter permease [Oceanobacillus damuensis]